MAPGSLVIPGPTDWRNGPPVLFVHGMWHGAWCWEHFIRRFRAEGYAADALNLSDHGDGRTGPDRLPAHALEIYVHDLERATARFRQPPILVGHSMGCLLIEVAMARLRPPAVILLAPTRHEIFKDSVLRFQAAHPWEYWHLFFGQTMWPPIETPRLAREMLFSDELSEEDLVAIHGRLQNESFLVAIQLRYGFGPRPAPPVGIPVFVGGGSVDRAVLKADLQTVASYHGTVPEIFPGLGHDLMLEPRHAEVSDALLAFLRRHHLAPAAGPAV